MYNHHEEQMTRNGAYARDYYRQRAEQAERERDTLRAAIERVVAVGQRQSDGVVLSALGFDLHNTKWRFGYQGWERQAEESQAGCFPATDWIDEFLAALPARVDGAETDAHN